MRTQLTARLLHFSALLLALPYFAAAQTPTWTSIAPQLGNTYADFRSIAFGNGVFVAVANLPFGSTAPTTLVRLATSPDATTWTGRTIDPQLTNAFAGPVRFLNGRFVILVSGGRNGAFTAVALSSADGVSWTPADQPASVNAAPTEMDFGGGRYVGAGGNGFFIGSANGTAWSPITSPLAGLFGYLDVAFGNGRWFATTNGAGGTVTSTDGVNWTAVPYFAQLGGYRVEWCNGFWFFYSQGNNAVSTDGVTFTTLTRTNVTPGGTATIRFVNGRLVAPGPLTFQTSLDGRNWSSMGNYPPPPSGGFVAMNEVAYGAGKYVYAGGLFQISPLIYVLNEADVPATPVAPSITTPPTPTNAVLGGSATFSVAATGSGNTYQWIKDTVNIVGATAATYTIATVTAASAGNYSVRITNSLGTITSTPVALTLVTASNIGRLINLSVLTGLDSPTDEFTLGYVVGGAGTSGAKPLVIRAAGPSLGALGVPGTLTDPKLETFAGTNKTGENDNWGGGTDVAGAMAAVGAFPYTGPTSRDAAVATSIATRDNSVRVTGVGGATGAVIAEVYDASPASTFNAATPRLLNVSVRKHLGTGLTAGFVVGGSTAVRVLIRVAGPGLAQFGVPGPVVDPQLALFNAQSVQIATNNDWANAADVTAAGNSVGAFALPANSRDAALVATLSPGNYSVRATGVNNTTGVALVEVYELP